jgi:ATP-dependent Clp protease ATP-binding subunit ClpC
MFFQIAAIALIVIGILVAWTTLRRNRRGETAAGPAAPTAGTGRPTAQPTSIYITIAPLQDALNLAAHPSELVDQPAMAATLDLLADPECTDQRLLDLAFGDHVGLRCAAFLAIARRGTAFTGIERVISEASSLPPWFFWYALRAIGACVPAAEPAVATLLVSVSVDVGSRGWCNNPAAVEYLRAFIGERLAAGEVAEFPPSLRRIIERHNSVFDLRRLLERLGEDLTTGWRGALDAIDAVDTVETPSAPSAQAPAAPADRERAALAELGRVWDRAPATRGRRLLETPLQTAQVERLRRNLEATPPRPCLLVGEPGVGKRAVIEALAKRLLGKKWLVLEAGHTDIIANQKYVGDMEGRLQTYLKEMGKPRRLWFIPDLGALRATGTHDQKRSGALHLLLNHFEAGDVRVIGTMTPSAWETLQQALPAVRGVFDVIKVEPLDGPGTLALAHSWLAAGTDPAEPLPANDRVIDEAWLLAQQFLSDRAAPGNLIQLLDQTRRRVMHAGGTAAYDRGDLVATLSELTGLPASFLDDRQSYDLQAVRRFFRERILGQDEAVECLVHRVAMLKSGLGDPSRPQGVFLFAGPTGTGKTEIAKVLAEFLFGSQERLIRVDMSEYNERGSAVRLLRANSPQAEAGGGSLVSQVRQRPFSVVLLDEFEKAASDVWDLFLQVADDGRLTDEHGETVDFRHTIIILTSNLGARVATGTGVGFGRPGEAFRPQDVEKAIEGAFRKEFINRLDRVVVFRPFTRETMRELLRLEIHKAERRRGLRHREWATIWDDSAVDFLLERGFTTDLGARPLRRAVERYLLEPLAGIIAQGRSPAGDQFLFVHANADRLLVDFIDPEATPAAPAAGVSLDATAGGDISPQRVLLDGHGGEAELAALATVHASLLARVGSDDLRRRKSDGLAAMGGSDFWDAEDRFAVLDRIENIDRVESGLESAGQLLERLSTPPRGVRGSGAARIVSPALLVKLAGSLHLLEAGVTAIEQDMPWDAYLLVDAGGDGSGASAAGDAWAQRLATMYERWAEQRRFKRVVLQESGGNGQPWRQVVAVSGYAACLLLATECGLHVWEDPDPQREGGFRRHPVLVRAVPQPARAAADRATALREAMAALAAPAPDRLQLVRHYRELPSPLVRDRLRGWRSGRLERVLGGGFDLMRGDD